MKISIILKTIMIISCLIKAWRNRKVMTLKETRTLNSRSNSNWKAWETTKRLAKIRKIRRWKRKRKMKITLRKTLAS